MRSPRQESSPSILMWDVCGHLKHSAKHTPSHNDVSRTSPFGSKAYETSSQNPQDISRQTHVNHRGLANTQRKWPGTLSRRNHQGHGSTHSSPSQLLSLLRLQRPQSTRGLPALTALSPEHAACTKPLTYSAYTDTARTRCSTEALPDKVFNQELPPGASSLAHLENPPAAGTYIPCRCRFASQLFYFPPSCLLVAWERSGRWP